MSTLIRWLDLFFARNRTLVAAWIGTDPAALAEAVEDDGQEPTR